MLSPPVTGSSLVLSTTFLPQIEDLASFIFLTTLSTAITMNASGSGSYSPTCKNLCDMNVSSTSTLAAVVMVGLDRTQEGHLLLVCVAQAAAVPVCLRPFFTYRVNRHLSRCGICTFLAYGKCSVKLCIRNFGIISDI